MFALNSQAQIVMRAALGATAGMALPALQPPLKEPVRRPRRSPFNWRSLRRWRGVTDRSR